MQNYLTTILSGNIKTRASLPAFQKQIQETNQFLDSAMTKDGMLKDSLTKIRPCPFCGEHSDNELMVWKGFHWKNCPNCQMAYVCNPLSQNFHEMDIYSSAIDHMDELDNNSHENNPHTIQANETLEYARKIFPDFGGVCDIGCGNGAFLNILKQKGIPVFGIDINQQAVNTTKSKGIPASLIQDFTKKDIAHLKHPVLFTMRQLIEHVEDVKKLIQEITSLSEPPWMLLIETPNLNSYNAGKLGFRHRHFYGWVHLQILSSKTMRKIAEDFKMNLLDVSTYGPARGFKSWLVTKYFPQVYDPFQQNSLNLQENLTQEKNGDSQKISISNQSSGISSYAKKIAKNCLQGIDRILAPLSPDSGEYIRAVFLKGMLK